MSQALSLHIGLNGVDPSGYGGWAGQLSGCVADALSMQAVAQSQGCAPLVLLNEVATASQIVGALNIAAQILSQGDYLLITFSGHGGRIYDGGIGDLQMHDTWVAYDRMIFDVELHLSWTRFNPGVRIVFVSDSCHSGTLARSAPSNVLTAAGVPVQSVPSLQEEVDDALLALFMRRKLIPPAAAAYSVTTQRGRYPFLSTIVPRAEIGASLLSLAACADDQVALDGNTHGLFTQQLLAVWNSGSYVGSYFTFMSAISQTMPDTEMPQYRAVGAPWAAFETQEPFTADPPGGILGLNQLELVVSGG